MPPRGRPRKPGTEEERAAARREQVRQNVRAFRKRQQQFNKSPNESDEGTPNRSLSLPYSNVKFNRSNSAITLDPELIPPWPPERRLAITQELNGAVGPENVSWSLQFPYLLNVGPAYRDAFISANRGMFTGGYEGTKIEICCGTWTAMAIIQASSPGANSLFDALLASGLSVIGLSTRDERLIRNGIEVQDRAITKLRLAMNQYGESGPSIDHDGTSLTNLCTVALACAMTELLGNKSWEKFSLHLSGVGALLQCATPAMVSRSLAAQSHFYGYRAVQLPFSFIHRQASFLGQTQWIDVPWRYENGISQRPLQRLIDVAWEIPLEMESFDKEPIRNVIRMSEKLRNLSRIRDQLEAWQKSLANESLNTLESQIHLASRRITNFQTELVFEDPNLAHSFGCYIGVRLGHIELSLQIVQVLVQIDHSYDRLVQEYIADAITWSIVASQCLNYFVRHHDPYGKLLCFFPFEMGWKMVEKLRNEFGYAMPDHERWYLETSEEVARSGLPVLIHR